MKKFACHCLAQELCTFLEPLFTTFVTLCGQFRKQFFLNSYWGGGTLLEDKRSNKVETVQHIKKCFLVN